MAGNKRMKENVLKGDANQHFPGKFLGPIDFEFVSLRINCSNSELSMFSVIISIYCIEVSQWTHDLNETYICPS